MCCNDRGMGHINRLSTLVGENRIFPPSSLTESLGLVIKSALPGFSLPGFSLPGFALPGFALLGFALPGPVLPGSAKSG